MKEELISRTEVNVRFHEVDSMRVVWHGNYVKYLEDGREDFGSKFGIHYLDFLREEIMVPLVNIELDYKKPLKYGEKAIVETKFINCEAAKLMFEYTVFRASDMEIVATAKSIQVFLSMQMELMLTLPDFFVKWKEKWVSS